MKLPNLYRFLASSSDDIDNGWSWIILISTFILGGMTWGMLQSIGIVYTFWIEEFDASKTEIALITGIPMFLMFFLSPLFQTISKYAQGYQIIGFIGSLLYSGSFFASSFVKRKYLLFFTFSIPQGIGLMLLATPIPLVVNQYFTKRVSTAIAVCTTGSFLFSMILPPLIIINKVHSWRNTFKLLSLFFVMLCSSTTLMLRKHVKHLENKDEREVLNAKTHKKENTVSTYYKVLLRSKNFRLLLVSCMLISIEMIVSTTHIVQYAIELNMKHNLAKILPVFLSGGQIFGRIVFGRIFDLIPFSKIHLVKVLLVLSGLIAIFGSFCSKFVHLATFAVSYGIISGAHSAQISVLIRNVVGENLLPYGWTLTMFFQSFLLLTGTALVGWISEIGSNYKVMFYTIAFSTVSGVIPLSFVDTKQKIIMPNDHPLEMIVSP